MLSTVLPDAPEGKKGLPGQVSSPSLTVLRDMSILNPEQSCTHLFLFERSGHSRAQEPGSGPAVVLICVW